MTSRAFSAYERPLEVVLFFKYLVRVLLVADDYCPAVVQNLSKSQEVWCIMARILIREGVRLRVSGFLFKSVAKYVLLFGAEMWVVTPRTG